MSNYDNTNRGALWPNREKQTDKQPDLKGQINVDGVEYWLSAWKRDPNEQNPKAPSLKIALTPKDQAHQQGMQQARQAAPQQSASPQNAGGKTVADFEDDIPFD